MTDIYQEMPLDEFKPIAIALYIDDLETTMKRLHASLTPQGREERREEHEELIGTFKELTDGKLKAWRLNPQDEADYSIDGILNKSPDEVIGEINAIRNAQTLSEIEQILDDNYSIASQQISRFKTGIQGYFRSLEKSRIIPEDKAGELSAQLLKQVTTPDINPVLFNKLDLKLALSEKQRFNMPGERALLMASAIVFVRNGETHFFSEFLNRYSETYERCSGEIAVFKPDEDGPKLQG